MRTEIQVIFSNTAADKEIRGDIIPLGQSVPVANVSLDKLVTRIVLLGKVELIDMVLYGVFGVGELLIKGNALRAVIVLVMENMRCMVSL